jgi:hypothetical protein
MRRIILAGLLAAISCLPLLPSAANAEVKCPEGKTATGDCVNPALAAAMRQAAIIFSQPQISKTAFPILPADDRVYRYPNQLIPSPLKPAPAWPGFE